MKCGTLFFRQKIAYIFPDELLVFPFQRPFQGFDVVSPLIGGDLVQPLQQARVPVAVPDIHFPVRAFVDMGKTLDFLVQVGVGKRHQRDAKETLVEVFSVVLQGKGMPAGDDHTGLPLGPFQRLQKRPDGIHRPRLQTPARDQPPFIIRRFFQVLFKIVEI